MDETQYTTVSLGEKIKLEHIKECGRKTEESKIKQIKA